MYSKVYTITCDPGRGEAMMGHYDAVVTPRIKDSPHHVGHQMIEVGDDRWILVSNYKIGEAAEAAVPMVQDIVGPLAQQFGMKLEVLGAGESVREV